jgi:dTDP-4-amino-4,6-dideoxygalactose transaminase
MSFPNPRFKIYIYIKDILIFYISILTFTSNRGRYIDLLENKIKNFTGSKYAIALPQARVGIYLAIKNTIVKGQKVILSPYTIADVINMVINAGGIPVFADIDRKTTNIQFEDIISKFNINNDVGAILITHLHGIPCEIIKIKEFCKNNNIKLIEDCCQSFGAKINNQRLGTFGDIGVFSIGMYKNISGLYGGILITNSETVKNSIIHEISNWPLFDLKLLIKKANKALFTNIVTNSILFKTIVFWIFRYGYLNKIHAINKFVTIELDTSLKKELPEHYKCNIRNIQARIALNNFDDIDKNSFSRIKYANLYNDGLHDINEIMIPQFYNDLSHIYNYYPIQYKERDKLLKYMMENNCDVAAQHLKNTSGLIGFNDFGNYCVNAQATASEVILLPNYPRYSEKQVKRNIIIIRDYFKNKYKY